MRISYLKYFYILLIVFILSMLGSFAYFSWSSGDSNNTNVSFDVVADTVYIYYDAGSSLNGADLYPTDDKSDGVSKDITVKIDKVVQSKPVTFNLYLDLTDVPEGLMNDSFKWALYDGDTQIKTGSITDTTTNCSTNNSKHITLLSGSIDTVKQQNYVLYLWIDGNMSNPDTMMNKSFKVNLHADGVNATLVEGKQIDIISISRNISNISSISLRSSNYNFNSYSLDGENGTWISFDCSYDKCNTDENKVYETDLSNLSLEFVDGIASIWVKNTNNDIQKLDIGKSYSITLDNDDASSGGTTTVYGVYKDGFYKDSSFENKYKDGDKIDIPTKTNSSFLGYYTAKTGGNKVINNNGEFVTDSIYYEDITLYARWQQATYNVVYDCTTNGGSTATTTSVVDGGTNADLTKTCSKSGWTFVGWNTSSTSTSKLNSYTVNSDVTLYGIYRKEAITLTAKWNANGASLSSTSNSSCTLEAVYNTNSQATSCTITAPTITRSGYTIVGYNTSSSSTSNNSSYNTSSKLLTLTSSNTGYTWYAISYKELSSNFYYYSGSSQTSTSTKCTIYNTTSVCTYTLPTVVSSSNGPSSSTYYGVSTAKSSISTTTAYNSNYANYYAVYSGKFTATYVKGSNVSSIGSTSNSCNNKFISNGTTYSGTSCSVTLPTITPSAGFVDLGWYNSSDTKIGNASASATLTSNITLTAKVRNLKAEELSYDNSATGEDCNDVQCMIDRLDTLIEERYG